MDLTPQENSSNNSKNSVDLDKILLPKKETPGQTPLSAERAPAGQLMAQEQAAAAEGTKAQLSPEEKLAAAIPHTPEVPAAPVDEDAVQPLETFQRDIQNVVKEQNVSVLTIAAAEADRRNSQSDSPEAVKEKHSNSIRNTLLVGGGLVLLVASSGVLAYLVARTTPLPPAAANNINAPFITVDGVKAVTITADEKRDLIFANLNAARQATSLSLGLIEQINVSESSTTATGDVVAPLPPEAFFNLMAPDAPDTLSRSIDQYLLGVHVYDGNQPFIIARVDSYEEAKRAMLEWETYMQKDLSPLFDYTPRKHIPEEGIASTTPQTGVNTLAPSNFVDKIIENQDARALVNSYGDVYFLWTFIDANTLVITTNEATLREVISRLKSAPILNIPGQTR